MQPIFLTSKTKKFQLKQIFSTHLTIVRCNHLAPKDSLKSFLLPCKQDNLLLMKEETTLTYLFLQS